MRKFDLETLAEKAEREKRKFNQKLKSRYRLARELGFNYAEAKILSFKNEELIYKLANERKKKTENN